MQEDIFSEEIVDEPDDIERVVVAGGDDGHGGSGRESETEEAKKDDENAKEKVKIKRKIGPRPIINVQRLRGPRGIGIMQSFFSDLKFKGKHNEKADLQLLMGRLEHWAHRLCPRMQFDEALKKIEKLGAKKEISNYVKRIRLGMEENVESESVLEHEPPNTVPDVDPFDQLLASTDVPEQPTSQEMTEEQRDRMLQNRLIAEEKRKARLERAQKLKAKFLENQKLQSQRENRESQTAESVQEAQNQNIESQKNNEQEEQMEIDENMIQGNVSVLHSNNVDEEDMSDIADNHRLIAEERRKARLERAHALKAKFLENQKLQSQKENRESQTAESVLEAQNQNIESQINNEQQEQIEIGENMIPGNVSVLHSNNVDEENVSDIADIQIERNYNQSNFSEKDKENSSNLKQIDPIGQDISVEGVDNCMGILTERNKAHPDIIDVAASSPDIV